MYSQKELECLEKKGNELNDSVYTFLEALVDVKPQHKSGEILESVPMMTLSLLEWKVCQWIHVLWLVVHLVLIICVTKDMTYSRSSEESTVKSLIGDIFVLIYASFFPLSNFMVRIRRFIKRRMKTEQTIPFVRRSIRCYNKVKDYKSIIRCIISFPLRILYNTTFAFELLFAGFTWAVYMLKMTEVDTSSHAWIKGLVLLFGWLVLLAPLTSYSPVFKLI